MDFYLGKDKLKRSLLCLIASLLIALAMVLMSRNKQGSDSMTMVAEGLSISTKLTLGQANVVLNVIYLVLGIITAKELLGFGTLCTVFLTGAIIDLINIIPFEINPYLSVIISLFLYSLGIELMIYSKMGMGAFEAFLIKTCENNHWKYPKIKVIADVFFFILGLVLKANFGLGTLVFVFLTGPCVGVWERILKGEKIWK